jgi:hypothetical protein
MVSFESIRSNISAIDSFVGVDMGGVTDVDDEAEDVRALTVSEIIGSFVRDLSGCNCGNVDSIKTRSI